MLSRDVLSVIVSHLERRELLCCYCVSRTLRELCQARLERDFGYWPKYFAPMPPQECPIESWTEIFEREEANKKTFPIEGRPYESVWVRCLGGRMVGKISLEMSFFMNLFQDNTEEAKEPKMGSDYSKQHSSFIFRSDYPPDSLFVPPKSLDSSKYGDFLFARKDSLFFVVFDHTDLTTLFEARFFLNWIWASRHNSSSNDDDDDDVRRVAVVPPPVILVGNKNDLVTTSKRGDTMAMELAARYGIMYRSISCKERNEEQLSSMFIMGYKMVKYIPSTPHRHRHHDDQNTKKCIIC